MSLTHAPAYTLLAGSQLRLSPHQTFNFGEFPKFDETVLVDMDSVLSRDIPALLHALSAVEYEASVDWHSLPSLHADATRGSEAPGRAGGGGAAAAAGGYYDAPGGGSGGPPAPPPKAPSKYHDPFVPAYGAVAPTGEAVVVPVAAAAPTYGATPIVVPRPTTTYAPAPAPAPAATPVYRPAPAPAPAVVSAPPAAAPHNPFANPFAARPVAVPAETAQRKAVCSGLG